MSDDGNLYEADKSESEPDPDEVPIRDRKVYTQPYDLIVASLMEQIRADTIFLRPLSERPNFQRRYVWPDILASRLIESILLNVPIPPCYLSQNDKYELDVIDGQQRIYSIYRFLQNQFSLVGLEVLKELNNLRFHKLEPKFQKQISSHTLRCVVITNESHPEIKFDVFERLNTNTVPLNAQELRNCIHRGALNTLLHEVVTYEPWLRILKKKTPDKRMRDEELALRFFSFWVNGVNSYRTPQKHWLNDAAENGRDYSDKKIQGLRETWQRAIDNSLTWFDEGECFRRPGISPSRAINRALFDLIMSTAARVKSEDAPGLRRGFRKHYATVLENEEFVDLIGRAVDHSKRTKRRFQIWNDAFRDLIP